jgi:hypothetical protein
VNVLNVASASIPLSVASLKRLGDFALSMTWPLRRMILGIANAASGAQVDARITEP